MGQFSHRDPLVITTRKSRNIALVFSIIACLSNASFGFQEPVQTAPQGQGPSVTLGQSPRPTLEGPPGPPEPVESPNSGEVLTSGPVHEAFAGPISFDPKPHPYVKKSPPKSIEEIPPDQKPVGTNIQWIPGYWAFDDVRDDFLWVSGVWREIPPNKQWVPGYWDNVDNQGFRWVSGAWTPIAQEEVHYFPTPPPTLEAGPNSPQPNPGAVWSPGYWIWNIDRYAWVPGMWLNTQTDWVWIPAHYVWTPSGCLFVQGYWDHVIERRGTTFAPVYFAQVPVQAAPIVFTPSIVIMPTVMVGSLFIGPTCNTYFFGDYYGATYVQAGYSPWFVGVQSRRCYDPVFVNTVVIENRRDHRYMDRMREDYEFRRIHLEARPPRTFVEQQTIINRTTIVNQNVTINNSRTDMRNVAVARPISRLAADPSHHVKYEHVDRPKRDEIIRQAEVLRGVHEQRLRQERGPAGVAGSALARTADMQAPRRAERWNSPISAAHQPPHAESSHARVDPPVRGQEHTEPKVSRQEQIAPTHPLPHGTPPGRPNIAEAQAEHLAKMKQAEDAARQRKVHEHDAAIEAARQHRAQVEQQQAIEHQRQQQAAMQAERQRQEQHAAHEAARQHQAQVEQAHALELQRQHQMRLEETRRKQEEHQKAQHKPKSK